MALVLRLLIDRINKYASPAFLGHSMRFSSQNIVLPQSASRMRTWFVFENQNASAVLISEHHASYAVATPQISRMRMLLVALHTSQALHFQNVSGVPSLKTPPRRQLKSQVSRMQAMCSILKKTFRRLQISKVRALCSFMKKRHLVTCRDKGTGHRERKVHVPGHHREDECEASS